MNKQFMAVLNNGWKFYEGTGKDAKQIEFVEGHECALHGTKITTWEDIEAAVALRNLKPVLRWARLITFEAVA
jgi:hypothetical protein